MPRIVERAEAIAVVTASREQAGSVTDSCLMCEIIRGDVVPGAVVAETPELFVFLPRFGVRWGHVVIAVRDHVETLTEAGVARWATLCERAYFTQAALSAVLQPLRCYVATLGSGRAQPMTCEHLHTHVVPIHEPGDRPARVLTWEYGVVTAEPAEFEALASRLRAAV